MVTFQKSERINWKYLFAFSFLAHLIFINMTFESRNIEVASEKVIKLKILDNLSKSKQIVQNEKFNRRKPSEKAFLSAKNNKVYRQTKARRVDALKVASSGAAGNSKLNKVKKKNRKKVKSLSDLGVKQFSKASDMVEDDISQIKKGQKSPNKRTVSAASNNDYLEDITLGDFTQLNTQEFEFFGFYHRIRQKLEQFWGRNIQDQMEMIFKSGRAIASSSNHITSLEIEINKSGEIVNVKTSSSSGIKELDSAAVDAFNQAGPFPNPPKGMVKNGKAVLKWKFVVNT